MAQSISKLTQTKVAEKSILVALSEVHIVTIRDTNGNQITRLGNWNARNVKSMSISQAVLTRRWLVSYARDLHMMPDDNDNVLDIERTVVPIVAVTVHMHIRGSIVIASTSTQSKTKRGQITR